MHRRRIFFLIILILCAKTISAYAQVAPVDSLVSKGDSLRRAYCFEQSLEEYSKALELATDTTYADSDSGLVMMISDKILLSENGRNMTGFVYKPTVVAKHMFSKEDFFLYYPLQDRSWRAVPDQLDTVSGPYAKALYAPADAESPPRLSHHPLAPRDDCGRPQHGGIQVANGAATHKRPLRCGTYLGATRKPQSHPRTASFGRF